MPAERNIELDERRRKQILEASLKCFLTFGFSKTSMDDIAKEAGVSRPLIYLKFRNKEDLFTGVFQFLMEGRTERAAAAAGGAGSRRARLMELCRILLIEPWSRIVGHPKTGEFYEMCSVHLPQVTETYQRTFMKGARELLRDKDLGEVFFLATEGLHVDLPSTKVLEQRLQILVERFAGNE